MAKYPRSTDDAEILPVRLRHLMEDQRITSEELALATGVATSTVTSWRIGTRQPQPRQLASLARALGVSMDYLVGNSDIRTPDTSIQSVCNATGLDEGTVSALQASPASARMISALVSSPDYMAALRTVQAAQAAAEAEPEGTPRRAELNTLYEHWVRVAADAANVAACRAIPHNLQGIH